MAQTHLIIGAGNMGGSLLSGWLDTSVITPRNVAIMDPSPGSAAVYAIERGAKHLATDDPIPASIDTVMLSIKPQLFDTLSQSLAERLPEGVMILSIMAGISMETLSDAFPTADIVRAMPNTPASLGKGITGYVTRPHMPDDVIARAETLLGASGDVVRVASDDQINAVTAISGSGPAYIFHMCEALAAAGHVLGLDEETAQKLARQTVIGAAALLENSEQTPTELRTAVTSPGGTTQAALDVLMSPDGQSALMRKAARAALDRARELSG